MRRTKKEKQQTHARIVEAAADRFRAEGINEAGISQLMQQAGLTHGGFYAHFSNKEALIAEACIEGFAQTQKKLTQAVREAPANGQMEAILNAYLSTDQRDQPASACILPTLAAEIARHSVEVRAAFTNVYREFLDYLIPFLPETTGAHQSDEAMVLLAGMVGTMLLARAIDDAKLSEHLLQVNRVFYKQAFSKPPLHEEEIQK